MPADFLVAHYIEVGHPGFQHRLRSRSPGISYGGAIPKLRFTAGRIEDIVWRARRFVHCRAGQMVVIISREQAMAFIELVIDPAYRLFVHRVVGYSRDELIPVRSAIRVRNESIARALEVVEVAVDGIFGVWPEDGRESREIDRKLIGWGAGNSGIARFKGPRSFLRKSAQDIR